MPFKSKAQQRWMYANHSDMAKEWTEDTDFKKLPERVNPKSEARRKLGELNARMKYAAMTPAFLRTVAHDGDVDIETPEFKERCRGLTGKAHLDDMDGSQLQQVAKMIWSKEAAEQGDRGIKKKTEGDDTVVANIKRTFSGAGAAGALAPTMSNMIAGAMAHDAPTHGAADFSRDDTFETLRKHMGVKDVAKLPSDAAVMGITELRKPDEHGVPGKSYKDFVVGLPQGSSEATAAHELGHIKNWRGMAGLLGHERAMSLATGLAHSQNLVGATSMPLSAYAAASKDPTWTPGLLQAGLAAPRLLDEGAATYHALRHLMKQHGTMGGLRAGASLAPAFGTYAALAGAPLAITAGRKLYRHYNPEEAEQAKLSATVDQLQAGYRRLGITRVRSLNDPLVPRRDSESMNTSDPRRRLAQMHLTTAQVRSPMVGQQLSQLYGIPLGQVGKYMATAPIDPAAGTIAIGAGGGFSALAKHAPNATPAGQRAINVAAGLHEGFERGVPPQAMLRDHGHASPQVIMNEQNMLTRMTGPGSDEARATFGAMRKPETEHLNQALTQHYGPRAVEYVRANGFTPAMRKHLTTRMQQDSTGWGRDRMSFR